MMKNIPHRIIYIYIYIYTYLYVYLKVERLFNKCKTPFHANTNFCPCCNKVINNDIPFEKHLCKTHYDTKHNCSIELPKEGDTTAFF